MISRVAEFLRRFGMLLRRRHWQAELDAEIAFHRELRATDLRAQGLAPAAAAAQAERRFGNPLLLRERSGDAWGWRWLEDMGRDLRQGLRELSRHPGFALVAVLSLALGIGANTAIFSLLNAVLLRPLPVPAPAELVLFGQGQGMGNTVTFPNRSWQLFSFPMYREFQVRTQASLRLMAVQSIGGVLYGRVGGSRDIEPINTQLVSGSYFGTLGLRLHLGRAFDANADAVAGGAPVAVASYGWWQRRFAGNPGAIGSTLNIKGTLYTIIGVAPRRFSGVIVGQAPDIWVPLAMEKQISPGWNGLNDKYFQSLYIVGRLRPGVSRSRASASANLAFHQMLAEYAGPAPSAERLEAMHHARVELTPAATGLSHLRGNFALPLEILMAVVGLVLLIACANLANLLLARAAARQREIALRLAIGASRGRLLRQMMNESLLLALLGGGLGLAGAAWACQLLLAMVSTGGQRLPLALAPDGRVLAFTLAISLFTAFFVGVAPAWRASRAAPAPSLQARETVSRRAPLSRALVAGQVALALVVLMGAGLFLRSLVKLTHLALGFDQRAALVFNVDESSAGYQEDARLEQTYDRLERRLDALPTVQAASWAMFTIDEGEWSDGVWASGFSTASRVQRHTDQNVVGPGYFQAMGIRLLAGRNFNSRDTPTSPKVAIINATMARRLFPSFSAIGRHFGFDRQHENEYEVIGVMADAKYDDITEPQQMAAFYPRSQHAQYLGNLVVRYRGNRAAAVASVRQAIHDVDSNLPVARVETLSAQVGDNIANYRLIAQLSAFFGLLAVLLASIGIYGLMAYTVARRTQEIGLRMALGAARRQVLWMVLRDVLALAALGVAVGVPLALAAERLAGSLLAGLNPNAPATLCTAALLMLAIAACAGLGPARRAARVDPMVALRRD